MPRQLIRVGNMAFGLILPNKGEGCGPESLDAGAATAAGLGWRSGWVTDHLIVANGEEADEYGTMLEALAALAWVGARHEELVLGTSVISPAIRDAAMLAKELATIDVLLGGRLVVGVGVSDAHDDPEYQNMGKLERFRVRGAYVDEAIALWRHLWSGSTEPFVGRFNRLEDFSFAPLPPRGAATPIWAGGRSDRAVRRTAELADGYHAAQTGPDELEERLPKLRAAFDVTGRPWPYISTRSRVKFGAERGLVPALVGSPDDMVADVVRFARLGNDELIVTFPAGRPEELEADIRRFHQDVIEPAAAAFAATTR
jgi:alkanesulfonate monooxygenase SsuD/methylene tetrahydromethanopterin reductase-like flavin-dependent oxidoreductase (luciferase family)